MSQFKEESATILIEHIIDAPEGVLAGKFLKVFWLIYYFKRLQINLKPIQNEYMLNHPDEAAKTPKSIAQLTLGRLPV